MKNRIIFYIAILSLYSLGLVAFRVIYTGHFTWFIYLIWNLFLAWVPFGISLIIYRYFKQPGKLNFVFAILFLLWLLFLPNTYYILTDFIHLKETQLIGLWYDLILISSFAINGIVLGLASTFLVHKVLQKRVGDLWSWTITISTFVLSSFGVYLGRFLRWNSWDVIVSPVSLIISIFKSIITPGILSKSYGMTILLSLFLIILYLMVWELGTKSKKND